MQSLGEQQLHFGRAVGRPCPQKQAGFKQAMRWRERFWEMIGNPRKSDFLCDRWIYCSDERWVFTALYVLQTRSFHGLKQCPELLQCLSHLWLGRIKGETESHSWTQFCFSWSNDILCGTIVSVSALSLQHMPPDVKTSLQQHGDDTDSRFYCGCNNHVAN